MQMHRLCVWLLCIPLAAVRDNINPLSLTVDTGDAEDACQREHEELKRILLQLGFTGQLDGDHCKWSGIRCEQGCYVTELRCSPCDGHLPEHIGLRLLKSVRLEGSNLSGNLSSFFHGMKDLPIVASLVLRGHHVNGDIKSIAAMRMSMRTIERLDLRSTSVFGNLQSLVAQAHLTHLDLSYTGVKGTIEDLQVLSMLQSLELRATKVHGDINVLSALEHITKVDLSNTNVEGSLTPRWRGNCAFLETLDLAKTRAQFLPDGKDLEDLRTSYDAHSFERALLPKLTYVDVSSCPLNAPAEDFVMVLAMSPRLTSIKAANAGLYGKLPELKSVEAKLHFNFEIIKYRHYTYPLATSLRIMDFSYNNITVLPDIPASGRVALRGVNGLYIVPGLLAKALALDALLDLKQTELINRKEAQRLWADGLLDITKQLTVRNQKDGFACHDTVGRHFRVTPAKFLPDQLCKCLEGWHGQGIHCKQCPADTFSNTVGQIDCQPCPFNSTSKAGARALWHCKCKFGRLHEDSCECDPEHALFIDRCVPCHKLHLQCNNSGSVATTAIPASGCMRLRPLAKRTHKCHQPGVDRCPGSEICGDGYMGTLCSRCAEGYWSIGGRCRKCTHASSTTWWVFGVLAATALLLAAFLAYRKLYGVAVLQSRNAMSLLSHLLVLEGPVLLQTVQLWAVLSRLGGRRSGKGFSPIPYLDALQFTVADLQNSLNLQCSLTAETVRTLAALGSPLLPLCLLACFSLLELLRAGLGVNMALRTLTVLFIGGAFSTAELLTCQAVDGDGRPLGSQYAFRMAFPEVLCSDHEGFAWWIDFIGYSCVVAYGVIIPLFLVGLMGRQYFALQEARLLFAHARVEPQRVTIHVQTAHGQIPTELRPKRLLAAAAAHSSVHFRGKIQVLLEEECITLMPSEHHVQAEDMEELDAMKFFADEESSKNLDKLKCRKITEMLVERILLSQTSDRLLVGARPILCKYALCQDYRMEVAMKLFAVALVSFVTMSAPWTFSAALCLGMAVLVWVSHPYMQPQVNDLQSFSCLCLALASAAFVTQPWMAQLALAAPLLLWLWQVRRPDCIEALAERCYQELESELSKLSKRQPHELQVELLRL